MHDVVVDEIIDKINHQLENDNDNESSDVCSEDEDDEDNENDENRDKSQPHKPLPNHDFNKAMTVISNYIKQREVSGNVKNLFVLF